LQLFWFWFCLSIDIDHCKFLNSAIMKILKSILGLFLILSLINGCKKDKEDTFTPGNINLSTKQQNIIQNTNDFGIRIFKDINSASSNENIFISPLSISMALGMTYNGSAGTTKTAFEHTLGFDGMSPIDINVTYKTLLDYFPTCDNKVTLDIANSIWYRQTFNVTQGFIDTNKKYFNAEVSALNFDDADAAKGIINKWVSDKTNNKIPTIINEITSDNVMFLINAVYFKGLFKMSFDKSKTIDETFYLANNTTKQVQMMNQVSSQLYFANNTFSSIELAYGNARYNMEIFLPKSGFTVEDIINELSVSNWNNWLNSYSLQKEVHIGLPKFKFSYEETLNNTLTKLGLGVAFTDQADFTNINPAGQLYISKVLHKTYVDVNEEGTEAAAVTSVGMSTTSTGNDTQYFIVDRPFLFVLSEKESKSILFIGKVMEPVY
jgi:serine protease inhibitor